MQGCRWINSGEIATQDEFRKGCTLLKPKKPLRKKQNKKPTIEAGYPVYSIQILWSKREREIKDSCDVKVKSHG